MLTYTIKDLEKIRDTEMELLLQLHAKSFVNADVLEIGAGTCRQLATLDQVAHTAVGTDILSSNYSPNLRANFVWYDGRNLPFRANSFDVVYSSNTMEHVTDEVQLHREIHRVLRSDGVVIHVVPSSTWRLWTMATYYVVLPKLAINSLQRRKQGNLSAPNVPASFAPKKTIAAIALDLICPMRHGEKGNRFTEWWHFRRSSWKTRFEQLGWTVVSAEGVGLFYSGYLLGAKFMSTNLRKRLSRVLGSSCLVFVLKSRPMP